MKTLKAFSAFYLALGIASSFVVVRQAAALTFEKKSPVKIGYSVYDMQQPYWQAYAKGISDAATAAGYGFVLSDQKSSQQAEVSGSIDLINQGISALIVSRSSRRRCPRSLRRLIRRTYPSSLAMSGLRATTMSSCYRPTKKAGGLRHNTWLRACKASLERRRF